MDVPIACLLLIGIIVLSLIVLISYNYRLYIHLYDLPHWRIRQTILRDMLYHIVSIFDKHNITYFAVDGTLLGLIRNNDVIPYDTDVDLGILYKQRSKAVTILQKYLPTEYTVGHLLKLGRLCPLQVIHTPTGVHADIESYFYIGQGYYRSSFSTPKGSWKYQNEYHLTTLFPLNRVRCNKNFRVCVPHKSRKILNTIYGCNWRKESMKYDAHRDKWIQNNFHNT